MLEGGVLMKPNRMTVRLVSTTAVLAAATAFAVQAKPRAPSAAADRTVVLAQAMIPPTGTNDAQNPMPMDERMHRRFPQPVRVGDLIGLPVLDDNDSTLGFVQKVVRTPAGKTSLVVSYSRWFGWFGRPVAVPIEAVVILGRQLASVDMQPSEYAAAPTWEQKDAQILPPDEKVRVGLGRR
jgi:hypothetical protein